MADIVFGVDHNFMVLSKSHWKTETANYFLHCFWLLLVQEMMIRGMYPNKKEAETVCNGGNISWDGVRA